MFSKTWETSKRQYQPVLERNVAIPVRAGFAMDCTIARPDANGKFPAIVSMHPFYNEPQFEPMMPRAINPQAVTIEGGDYNFYVRRGYVMVMANCRGTGRSGGTFVHMGDGMTEDLYDVIEWAARQPWCDGQVATFGSSYFAMTANGLLN